MALSNLAGWTEEKVASACGSAYHISANRCVQCLLSPDSTGGRLEFLIEQFPEPLIVGKAMALQKMLQRNIRHDQVMIDFGQTVFVQILQIGHPCVFLKKMTEVIDL